MGGEHAVLCLRSNSTVYGKKNVLASLKKCLWCIVKEVQGNCDNLTGSKSSKCLIKFRRMGCGAKVKSDDEKLEW